MYPTNDYSITSENGDWPTRALGKGLSLKPKHDNPDTRGRIRPLPDTNRHSPRIANFTYPLPDLQRRSYRNPRE